MQEKQQKKTRIKVQKDEKRKIKVRIEEEQTVRTDNKKYKKRL